MRLGDPLDTGRRQTWRATRPGRSNNVPEDQIQVRASGGARTANARMDG
jgi:hypothetical protein